MLPTRMFPVDDNAISTVFLTQRLVVWETLLKQAKDVQWIVNTSRLIASLLATMTHNASQIVQEKLWLVWINAHAILVIRCSLLCKVGGHFWVEMKDQIIWISNNAIDGPNMIDWSSRTVHFDRLLSTMTDGHWPCTLKSHPTIQNALMDVHVRVPETSTVQLQ